MVAFIKFGKSTIFDANHFEIDHSIRDFASSWLQAWKKYRHGLCQVNYGGTATIPQNVLRSTFVLA
jgi:hypothetical protein